MAVTMRYRQQLFQISSAGGAISNVCTTMTYRGLTGFLVPHETVSTLVANAPRLRLHEEPSESVHTSLWESFVVHTSFSARLSS